MKPVLRTTVVAAALCAAVVPATAEQTHAASAKPTGPGTSFLHGGVVAVRGDHHALLANRPGHRKLRDLGGHIGGSPAVADAAGRYFFVAATVGGRLEVRTEGSGWAPLVTHNDTCTQPELSSNGSRLALICLRHTTLFADVFTAPKRGLPTLSRLHDQGGHYVIGAGISFFGNPAYEQTVGKRYEDDLTHFDTYARNYNEAKGRQRPDSEFNCAARPTATSGPRSARVFSGCVTKHGTKATLSLAASSPHSGCTSGSSNPVGIARIGIARVAPNVAVVVYRAAHHRLLTTEFSCSRTSIPPVQAIGQHIHGGPALAPPQRG